MGGMTYVKGYFFFNETTTTEIYTLSLHDALPDLSGKKQTGRRCGVERIQVVFGRVIAPQPSFFSCGDQLEPFAVELVETDAWPSLYEVGEAKANAAWFVIHRTYT